MSSAGGAAVVVVRQARGGDEAARVALVRDGLRGHFRDAFLLFFFQELTLQCCVLCGAVLFIFCGASLGACALVAPAAAALVAVAVHVTHLALADKHHQDIRKEMSGWVAEARGPPDAAPRIYSEAEARRLEGGVGAEGPARVVGTVSLSELWGPRGGGWLHALAVHAEWRRRGVGRALGAAARGAAAGAGLGALEAVASELQGGARALLHAQGWRLRASYRRPVVGAAATLLVAQLGLDLPGP